LSEKVPDTFSPAQGKEKWEGGMAEGVDAVKAALERDFRGIKIHQNHDIDTGDCVLSFEADFLPYQVRVTREYDSDYASGQVNVDLSQLAAMLRASNSGKARVFRGGIIPK
jgi:hypothetical protein